MMISGILASLALRLPAARPSVCIRATDDDLQPLQSVEPGHLAAADRSITWRTDQQRNALADAEGRPIAFILTPGNVADISVAAALLDETAPPRRLPAESL